MNGTEGHVSKAKTRIFNKKPSPEFLFARIAQIIVSWRVGLDLL